MVKVVVFNVDVVVVFYVEILEVVKDTVVDVAVEVDVVEVRGSSYCWCG